ncbi:MAG: FG-GAP-like repeat-containing protein, partial [Verrucomicrobiota bacterium]
MLLIVLTFGLYLPKNSYGAGGNVFAWGNSGSGETQIPPGLNSMVDVACGNYFSMALKADGTIATWGDNGFGLRNVPAEATNVVAIATRGYNCLVLRRDGSLVMWGSVPPFPAAATGIVAIAVGGDHHLALREDGKLLAWGANNYGQCNVPTEATNITGIAAGYTHSIALRKDGRILAWGENIGGATSVPLQATNITTIAAGPSFNLALRKDGRLFAWGLDWGGNLDVPAEATNVIAISAGELAGYAIRSNGTCIAWGRNDSGQLNIPAGLAPAYMIGAGNLHALGIRVTGAVSFLRQPASRVVLAGDSVVFNVPAIGQMPVSYQWRSNGIHLIEEQSSVLLLPNLQQSASFDVVAANGFGAITSQVAAITVLPSAPVITRDPSGRAVSIGGGIVFSVSAKGSQPLHFQWQRNGEDLSGQTNSALVLNDLQSAQSGLYRAVVTNSIGFITSGEAILEVVPIFAWGTNASGVLDLPFGLTNVTALAAGYSHNIALKADGSAIGWGNNNRNQSAVPAYATNLIAVAVGDEFSFGLKSNGTLVAWGSVGNSDVPVGATNVAYIASSPGYALLLNNDGSIFDWPWASRPAVPAAATNLATVAAGVHHALGLQKTGNLLVWGNQTVPVGGSNLLAISAGWDFSLALRNDGTILAWGSSFGQTNVPAGATNIVAVSAGSYHAMALRDDGRIFVWGYTNSGQGNVPLALSLAAAISSGNTHDLALMGTGELRFVRTPRLQTVSAGSRLVLSAWAVGEGPVTYQWARNGTNISGATSAYLLVMDVQDVDMADYSVVVTGGQGSITSNIASVTITPSAPLITQQPTNRLVLPGSATTFAASAQGTAPLSYQWKFNDTPLLNAMNSSLILTNVQLVNGGDYHVVITNAMGGATSVLARLEIYPFNLTSVLTNTSGSWSSDWGDYDNDGRLDLLVGGKAGGQPISATARLFHNDGNGNFSETNVNFAMSAQSVRWGDFDNDGFLDALLAGPTTARISRNNGNGTFTNLTQIMPADSSCLASIVDYDLDGRLDISLGGKLYRNLGGNQFTNVNAGLPITQVATTAWGDYNRDGFPDVLLCGLVSGGAQLRLFRNLGNGTFTNVPAGFQDIYRGQAAWLDFDADGWLDVVVSGQTGPGVRFSALYRNQGDGTFSNVTTGLPPMSFAWLAVGDADNDGQPDLFLSGDHGTGNAGRLFHGMTNGGFSQVGASFPTDLAPFAAWGDYDADGRLDLALSTTESGQTKIGLYRNDFTEANIRPEPPTNVIAVGELRQINFKWDPGNDAQTPAPTLTYALRVGRTSGANNVLSANAGPDGFRRVARPGNAGSAQNLSLTNLPFGRYYWAVQTVDSAYAGSSFTLEQVFQFAASTLPATGVTSSQAILNGMLDTNRLPAVAWFEWGTTTNYGNVTSQQTLGTNAASALLLASLTDLLPDSSYYFRLVVTNADGIHY